MLRGPAVRQRLHGTAARKDASTNYHGRLRGCEDLWTAMLHLAPIRCVAAKPEGRRTSDQRVRPSSASSSFSLSPLFFRTPNTSISLSMSQYDYNAGQQQCACSSRLHPLGACELTPLPSPDSNPNMPSFPVAPTQGQFYDANGPQGAQSMPEHPDSIFLPSTAPQHASYDMTPYPNTSYQPSYQPTYQQSSNEGVYPNAQPPWQGSGGYQSPPPQPSNATYPPSDSYSQAPSYGSDSNQYPQQPATSSHPSYNQPSPSHSPSPYPNSGVTPNPTDAAPGTGDASRGNFLSGAGGAAAGAAALGLFQKLSHGGNSNSGSSGGGGVGMIQGLMGGSGGSSGHGGSSGGGAGSMISGLLGGGGQAQGHGNGQGQHQGGSSQSSGLGGMLGGLVGGSSGGGHSGSSGGGAASLISGLMGSGSQQHGGQQSSGGGLGGLLGSLTGGGQHGGGNQQQGGQYGGQHGGQNQGGNNGGRW